jgi:hypothetical protein
VFPVAAIAFPVFTIYENVSGTVAPYDRFRGSCSSGSWSAA